jgi:predicted amidohydrolase
VPGLGHTRGCYRCAFYLIDRLRVEGARGALLHLLVNEGLGLVRARRRLSLSLAVSSTALSNAAVTRAPLGWPTYLGVTLAGIVAGQRVRVLDHQVGLAAVGLLGPDDPRYLEVVEHGDAAEGRGARDFGDFGAGELLVVNDGYGPALKAHVGAAEAEEQQRQEQQRAYHQEDVEAAEDRRRWWSANQDHYFSPVLGLLRDAPTPRD